MGRRSGVSIRTTTYSKFKGVDFSTDASLVEPHRSPVAVNMIADTGGMPEKRVGWRKLHQIEQPVNGLFYGVIDGVGHFLAHGGTKLYKWGTTAAPTILLEGVHNGKSACMNMMGKLWILTGGEYLCYDGETAKNVGEMGYIPTTLIGATPSGAGKAYESINLMQKKRRNEFIPDGATKLYQLDAVELDADEVTVTVAVVEEKEGADFTVTVVEKKEGTDFTVDRVKGTVTFVTAPPKPPGVMGNEVIITFAKSAEGRGEKVARCTVMTSYGVGRSDRLVISGNPAFPNLDWMSEVEKPDYIPDTGYSVVGTESTAIVGYRRMGEHLAIIKEDNGQDSTIFLRSAGLNEKGEALFPVKQSIAGVGAVSRWGFGNILDEQLFLARGGVYALTTNALTAERIVENRSFFVDNRLTRERGLDKAVTVNWNGMFLVGVNGRVYLLDGRQDKTYRAKSQSDFVYECYYWEGVPAACWLNVKAGAEERLYFGTEDGRICRFNDDVDTMERYSDDGAAIFACWGTVADDDGDVTLLKTLIKQGNAVTIKPYTRSSAQVCVRTDKDPIEREVRAENMDIFDWEDIDFSRFSFDSNDGPREIMFNTKVKKYKRLQIIIKNDALNEGFGIFGITKHFVVGNFAKR